MLDVGFAHNVGHSDISMPFRSFAAAAMDASGTVERGGTGLGAPGNGGRGNVASMAIFESVFAPAAVEGSSSEPDMPSMVKLSRLH